MKTLSIIWITLIALACTKASDRQYADNFFAGQFVYFADAANFTDCATGMRYPVAMQAAYVDAERAYTSQMSRTPGEPLFVQFRGHIDSLPAMEDDALIPTLVIDSFEEADPVKTCTENALIAGLYRNSDGSTLHLRPDRSYVQRPATGEIVEGRWGQASAMEVVLNSADGAAQARFEYIPDRESLVLNSGSGPSVYVREYIR